MAAKSIKSLLVAVLTTFLLISSISTRAQHIDPETGAEHPIEKKGGFDAKEVIFDHIMDKHEFHITDYKGSDGVHHAVVIPLPVLLYSPQKGLSFFMSSKFDHGHAAHDGYKLAGNKIVSTDGSKVYDFSLTRNVAQMILALGLLVWLMTSVANSYKTGQGVVSAPKGKQNLVEVMVTFVRDEIARPNLGHKVDKYLPFLLTMFFFILINNLVGLIPATANVTGNIAFTAVLGVISFVVIMFSTRKHYWMHILWPPGVPHWVKIILVPVEIMSIFIKPFALIIRLFANMVAGHIIIICLIALIFIFKDKFNAGVGWGTAIVSVAFTIFIYFIEVLVAFLQAFIFAILTAVFIGQAFEGEHHHKGEHDDAVIV